MKNLKALIAVRSGSVRVKDKNLKNFAGSSLLSVKIEQLKRVPQINGVVVNSNSYEMLRIAEEMGAETVKRDDVFASNTVSMSDVYQNMAENFPDEYILYANCTNPLVKDETISKAIEIFEANMKGYDSLNSAHLIKEFLFLNGKTLNYDLQSQPRSQDLPDIFALNFAISIISRENMAKCRNVVGNTPYIFGIDDIEATDIDNEIDFDFAEFLYMKNIRYREETKC